MGRRYATATIILAVVIGFAAGVALGMAIGPVFGFPRTEGSSAIFGVLIGGPLGAVMAGMLAFRVTRRFAGDETKQKVVLAGAVAVAAVLLLGPNPFGGGELRPINPNGSSPNLWFEIRLPHGVPAPAKSDVEAKLRMQGSPSTPTASFYDNIWLAKDGEQIVIKGHVEMYARSPQRTLALSVAGKPTHLFALKLAEKPKYSDELGSWQATDQLEYGGAQRPPAAGEAYEIRYRVHGY
jgi:hypothetical protein